VTGGDLLVDVRQLAPRVFQEEFALHGVDAGKEIDECHAEPSEEHGAILMKKDVFVGNEELQFIHQPEAKRKQDGDGKDECVSEHDLPWS
jgi:hypothetical protein